MNRLIVSMETCPQVEILIFAVLVQSHPFLKLESEKEKNENEKKQYKF